MSDERFRWLHLSDFHVGKDQYGQCCLFKYILENVKNAVSAGKPPHAVFITGDIANSGEKSEYDTFFYEFLWPLHELLIKTPGSDLIYAVPGNHDVTRSKARAVRTHGLLSYIPTLLDPTIDAKLERETLFPRFQAFIDNDPTSGDAHSHWISSVSGCGVRRFVFRSKKIGVLCLNSAWLSGEGDDRHNLSPGKGIIEKGLEDLHDEELVFVLAHHPIDWFVDEEVNSIRSLLGNRPAVYLCGHLHKTSATPQPVGTGGFLTLLAGAAFQAREDEKWINRIVWGELDADAGTVRVIPQLWSRDHQEWLPDTTAFPSDLRVSGEDCWQLKLPTCRDAATASYDLGVAGTRNVKFALPLGWVSLDKNALESFERVVSDEEALTFFDGRIPSWSDAQSPKIPRRLIVPDLVARIGRWKENPTVTVFLLKGAGGEGKSTVLLQVVCDLLKSDIVKRVLWNESAEADGPKIDHLPGTMEPCIVASDDAESVATEMWRLARSARERQRNGTCILLACRDTDWIAAGCDHLPWGTHAQMIDIPLRGLSKADAVLIVEAWERQGARGLGQLYGRSQEEAVEALVHEALGEAYTAEGAFLGAMLRTRMGADLKAHVKSLLVNLGDSKAPGGTLRNAFAYIATPHAENVLILSRGPLAMALGCPRSEIKEKVLGPLGEEAVVAPSGLFVLTRHRAIAEAAVDILSHDFHVDTDEILLQLMVAALQLAKSNVFVPSLASWRFLSNHFLKAGKHELAVRLAQAAFIQDETNPFFIVQLAKMLRISAQADASVQLFHRTADHVERDRTFYFEWGMSEGVAGNRCNSICLAAMSLADDTGRSWPSTEDAARAFVGMGTTFHRLFELYEERQFIEACSATVQLGVAIKHDEGAAEYFAEAETSARDAGVGNVTMPQAFVRLKGGILAAWERRETDLSRWLPPVAKFTYNHVRKLLHLPQHEDTIA